MAEKQLYVMARVMGELPSGQKLIGIMANNADGIRFYTEDTQLFTADDILRAADAVLVVRCKDCKHQQKVWHPDKRMISKGYYLYWCN